jgi:hypothetical protein
MAHCAVTQYAFVRPPGLGRVLIFARAGPERPTSCESLAAPTFTTGTALRKHAKWREGSRGGIRLCPEQRAPDTDGTVRATWGWSRRGAIQVASILLLLWQGLLQHTQAALLTTNDDDFGIFTDAAALVYRGLLGAGSYKTVYMVAYGEGDSRWALAVERLTTKDAALEALQGIAIAQELHAMVPPTQRRLFERIDAWWFQSAPVATFSVNASVQDADEPPTRFKRLPSRVIGALWLVSLKPVYSMDLERFRRLALPSNLISDDVEPTHTSPAKVAGLALDERGALQLALDLCTAGRVLHQRRLLHRDIKPKNIMLDGGRPVMIDFGFTQTAQPQGLWGGAAERGERRGDVSVNAGMQSRGAKHMCIGGVEGEVEYVLASDVWRLRGCSEGDLYAMGKTLFEVIFDSPQPRAADEDGGGRKGRGKAYITGPAAQGFNNEFRQRLASQDAGKHARFCMTSPVSTELIAVIRGLCRPDGPISFADAERALSSLVKERSQGGGDWPESVASSGWR